MRWSANFLVFNFYAKFSEIRWQKFRNCPKFWCSIVINSFRFQNCSIRPFASFSPHQQSCWWTARPRRPRGLLAAIPFCVASLALGPPGWADATEPCHQSWAAAVSVRAGDDPLASGQRLAEPTQGPTGWARWMTGTTKKNFCIPIKWLRKIANLEFRKVAKWE